MASLAGQIFDGSTGFTDSNDTIQSKLGNVTWFSDFALSGEELIALVRLWACHSMGLCCPIACEYAMYRGSKLASRPDSIAIHIACHPQKWSLLQEQPTPTFSIGGVEFVFVPELSIPGKVLHYVIRYEGDEILLRIRCIDSVNSYGPRSNMDLSYYIWSTFEYYCNNYAIVMLPSQTSEDKIVYVRQYEAEIGGETSQHCGRCVCIMDNPRTYYNFGCKKTPKV